MCCRWGLGIWRVVGARAGPGYQACMPYSQSSATTVGLCHSSRLALSPTPAPSTLVLSPGGHTDLKGFSLGPLHTAPWLPSQSLSIGNVTTLLGQNVGDLQKARSHPTVITWLRSLNRSALGELGLDNNLAGPTTAQTTKRFPSTTRPASHLTASSSQPWNIDAAPISGTAHVPCCTLQTPGCCPFSSRTYSFICLLGDPWAM